MKTRKEKAISKQSVGGLTYASLVWIKLEKEIIQSKPRQGVEKGSSIHWNGETRGLKGTN